MNGRMNFEPDSLLRMIDAVNDVIAGRNIPADSPADFWPYMASIAGQLANRLRPIHVDPNITFLWCVGLVLAAWVGCIAKAKLYSLKEERPELTDEQRREMAAWLGGLGESIKGIYESGAGAAGRFRASKGQQNYRDWESS